MNYKKILVISLICILCISMMPIAKATETEFKTITLEQIADSIKEEEIKEIAYFYVETDMDKVKVSKSIKENTLTIVVEETRLMGEVDETTGDQALPIVYKHEFNFLLLGNILCSPFIKINEDVLSKTSMFEIEITEKVFTEISKLMGYSSRIMPNFFYSDDFRNSKLSQEGIEVVRDKSLPIVEEGQTGDTSFDVDIFDVYKIDLSRKAIIKDLRTPLEKAQDLFEEKYGPKLENEYQGLHNVRIETIYNNEFYNGEEEERHFNDFDIVTDGFPTPDDENNRITSFYFLEDNSSIIKTGIMSVLERSDKIPLTASALMHIEATNYFIDCIGQAIYGYKEGELLEVIQKDTINDYTLAKEGFEKIDLGNEDYQYKIDISKKVPLTKEEQKPQEPEKPQNNTIDNNKNEVVDNTTAKGQIPQTGHELTNIVIAIGIISSIIAIIAYKVKKQDI